MVLLGALGAAPARAYDLWGVGPLAGATAQLSTNFDLRYHRVPEKLTFFEDRRVLDYAEAVFRANLLISKPGLVIGAQLDHVSYYGAKYYLDGELVYERPLYDPSGIVSPWEQAMFRMEKLYATRRWEKVELTVGDTYAAFGRGVVLNVIKNTGIDIDTSITGASTSVRLGDLELSGVTGLTNPQDVSQFNPNRGITEDRGHMISGARLAHYALGPVQAQAFGVLYRFARSDEFDLPELTRYGEPVDALAGGASLEAMGVGGLDMVAEVDVFDYRAPEMVGDPALSRRLGYAGYAALTAYPGAFSVLLEAKRTLDTERINTFTGVEGWEIAAAPTLEYENVITEDASHTVNSNDLMGARARVDWSIRSGEIAPYLSFAGFRDHDVGGEHANDSPETIGHAIAGVQYLKGRGVVQINAGVRRDLRDDAAEGMDKMAHLDAEVQIPITETGSFEIALNGRKFAFGVNELQQSDFLEMNNALGWHQGEKWVFLVYQDYSSNDVALAGTEGNLAFIDPALYGEDKVRLFGAGEIIYHPRPSSTVRVFYGAYKAGIRCAGGQCRNLPGFEGARLTWTSTF
jgi:hypothetical protein